MNERLGEWLGEWLFRLAIAVLVVAVGMAVLHPAESERGASAAQVAGTMLFAAGSLLVVTALLLASPRLVVFWPARLRALLVDGRAWIVRAAALATAIFPALVDLGPKSLGCRPAAA